MCGFTSLDEKAWMPYKYEKKEIYKSVREGMRQKIESLTRPLVTSIMRWLSVLFCLLFCNPYDRFFLLSIKDR